MDLQRLARALCQHWAIENGVFYMRDVRYGEDRNYSRITGLALSVIRNTGISLIRLLGYPYMTMLGVPSPPCLVLASLSSLHKSVEKPWFTALLLDFYTILYRNFKGIKMKKLSSPNISTEVFNALKERIIRWKYAPGHRFTEEGLCSEFGVSRSPVREALRMLVENGLVEKEPYRGYSVKQSDMKEILEFYDVRLALELFVVGTLAETGMDKETWDQLHDAWQTILEEMPEMNPDFTAKDEKFHETLAQATSNQTLIQTLQGINERLHFIRINDITNAERLRRTCEQHLKILHHIQNHDAAGAQEALLMNIQDGITNIEQAVKEALVRAYLDKG